MEQVCTPQVLSVVLCFSMKYISVFYLAFIPANRGQGGAVVTHSPLTSEINSSNRRPPVEKLVVSHRWSAVYLDQLYVLVTSAHKTTRHDMTCTVWKATLEPK